MASSHSAARSARCSRTVFYPGPGSLAERAVTVPINRCGRPVQKPSLMPLLTARSVARTLQAAQVGTV